MWHRRLAVSFFLVVCVLFPTSSTTAAEPKSIEPKLIDRLTGSLCAYSPSGQFIAYLNDRNYLSIESLRTRRDVDESQVAELIKQLDSDRFHQRNMAYQDLRRLGSRIQTEIAKRLDDKKISLEMRERLTALQDAIYQSAHSIPRRRIRKLVFSANDEFIAIGGEDHNVSIWRAASRQQEGLITSFDSTVYSLAFSNNVRWLAIGTGNGDIFIYDLQRSLLVEELNGHTSAVTDLAFSPDDRILYSGGGFDKRIGVWDVDDIGNSKQFGKRHQKWLAGHKDSVSCIAVAPDGSRIVSAGYDRKIVVWDANERTKLVELSGHTNTIRSLRFVRNSDHVVSGSEDRSVRLWKLSDAKQLAEFSPSVEEVQCVSILPSSNRIAVSGNGNRITEWEWQLLASTVQ